MPPAMATLKEVESSGEVLSQLGVRVGPRQGGDSQGAE